MAFTLDIALAGEESIERALTSIGGKLKKAEDEAARLSIAAEKAIQAVGTDYAKAAARAETATGKLNTELREESAQLQKVWQDTQKYNNILRDQQKIQQMVHRSSKEYRDGLRDQIAQMRHAGTATATLLESKLKLIQREKELQAQSRLFNSSLAQRVRAEEAALKTAKALEEATRKRAQRTKELTSELAHLATPEGRRTVLLEQQLKSERELLASTEKRRQDLRKLESELKYLNTADGKRQELMKSELALQRQLIQEGAKQSAELRSSENALKRYNTEKQREIELAKLQLAEKKKSAKAWAEEKLGIQQASSATKSHTDSIKRLREEIRFLQSEQGKEYLAQQRQIRQLKQARDELQKAGTATDRFKRQVRELTGSLNLANQATAGFRAGLAGIGTSFGMFTSSTILFASAVYGVGSALKSSVQAGVEFESQMDRVNAIMDASGANTVRLTEEVRSLAENTVFTAREVSDGLMYLGMAGLKTEDALTALEPSLRLASIGMLDMGTTADIVTNIMVGMGLEAGQISEIVDDMATAITNSNMDVRQLGNAMSYVAPLAREADISLQEITASLEVLHNTGIKASRAGTAMRTSMLSLLAPTAEAMEVLQRYGIQVDDNSGRMRNWTELLTEMAEAQMTLSDIEAIVGKRQAAGLKAMIDSAKATEAAAEKAKKLGLEVGKTASELKVLTQQLHENAGAAKVMQSIMEDNLKGDWLKLQAAVEEKYLEFYDMNKEELRYLVQAATDFVKSLDIEDINEQFRTMAGWIAEIVQLLAAARVSMMALGAVNLGMAAGSAAASYGALGAEWLKGRKAGKTNPTQLYSNIRQQTDNRLLAGFITSGAESRKYTQTIPGALASTARIATSVTPVGAGRNLLAQALKYGAQAATVGGVGYGVYSAMDNAGAQFSNRFGLGRDDIDFAMENRLSRYQEMGAEQLIAEYNSIQGALETTAAAYAMAQEELHKHLALENLEEADKVRATMEQQTRQAEELALALQAAGIAKDESGLFGSQAEAEMALAKAGAEYLTMQASFQNLSKLFVEGKVSAEALEQAQEGVRVKQAEVARLAETVNTYKAQTLKHEQALKAAHEDTANKAKDVVQSYHEQKAELLGQVSLQDKLKSVRAERLQLEKEYLGEEQKGLSNTNSAKDRALKLLQEEQRIKGQIEQQNSRLEQGQKRALDQAQQSLDQAAQKRDQLAAQYESIEYINAAYERGILLLDDEQYQRELAIRQQEIQILRARERLELEKQSETKTEKSLATREKEVAVQEEILRLLGRQKVELSESVRFAQQQVSSLESMYSTIESETIGLLERGFKDSQSFFDSIVGSFKRMLAELAYQAAIKPIIVNMVATMGGMMGMGSAANTWAANQGVTVGGGFGNLIDMGKNAWNFWKGGGQADVSWFNDFARSGLGQTLGLSTAAGMTTTGGYAAFASAFPNTAGYLGMGAGTTTATSGLVGLGGTATSTAPGMAVMGQGASLFSQGLSYTPWGALGALAGGMLGVQGAENPWINAAFTTGGSILGGMAGAAIAGGSGLAAGAAAGSWAGPVGAAIGAVLGMTLGGSLFGGDKTYRMRGTMWTGTEGKTTAHMDSHPHEYDYFDNAFGRNVLHINKYGDVNEWKGMMESWEALDAMLAGSLSKDQTAAAKAAVHQKRWGGERGDQYNMEDYLRQRYQLMFNAADADLGGFVGRNTEFAGEGVAAFSILNTLKLLEELPKNMGGFLTLRGKDEDLASSISRNTLQANIWKNSEGLFDDMLPDITGIAVEGVSDLGGLLDGLIGKISGGASDGNPFAGFNISDFINNPEADPSGLVGILTSHGFNNSDEGLAARIRELMESGALKDLEGGNADPLISSLVGTFGVNLTEGMKEALRALAEGKAVSDPGMSGFGLFSGQGLFKDIFDGLGGKKPGLSPENLTDGGLQGLFLDYENLEGQQKEFADMFITALEADLYDALKANDFKFTDDLAAQWEQLINDALASIQNGDGLAAQIMGEFIGREIYEAFKQGSETQEETVARVVSQFQAIDSAFKNLGLELEETGMAALEFSEELIGIAGGFENLAAALDSYYQNFYSQEELTANTMRDLTKMLEDLGYGIPTTAEDFRALVEELERLGDLEGFYALIENNEAFAQYYAQMTAWTQGLYDAYRQAMGRDPSALELHGWLDKLKKGEVKFSDIIASLTEDMMESISHLSEADLESIQLEVQGLYDAYNYTMELAQEEHQLALERIRAEEALVESLRGTIDSLKMSNVSPLTPAERVVEARKQYEQALASKDGSAINSAAQAYLSEAANYYSSSDAYKNIFSSVLGTLEEMERQYSSSLTYEERKEALDQELLDTQERAKALLEEQLMALAEQYGLEKNILEVLKALPPDLSALIAEALPESVAEALKKLREEYEGGPQSSDGLSLAGVDDRIIQMYKDIVGEMPDSAGAYYWQTRLDNGESFEDLEKDFRDRQAKKDKPDGSHFYGLDYVPYDGYKAILHRGEKVIPAAKANDSEKSALIAEIRALRAEVAQLREDQNRNAQRAEETTVVASRTSAEVISQSTKDAISRKEAADKAAVTLR